MLNLAEDFGLTNTMNKTMIKKMFIIFVGIGILILAFIYKDRFVIGIKEGHLGKTEDENSIKTKEKESDTWEYNGQECDNYEDIEEFDEPISVSWTAKFNGCLMSCWGASFTRDSSDVKHTRFSAYVPDDGEKIADKFLETDKLLIVSGMWTGVGADHVGVFDRQCVPTIDIESIEIVDEIEPLEFTDEQLENNKHAI